MALEEKTVDGPRAVVETIEEPGKQRLAMLEAVKIGVAAS
jgi:hypothetical protein